MSECDWGAFVVHEVPEAFLRDFDEGVRAAGRQARDKGSDLVVTDRDRARVVGQIRTAVIEGVLLSAARSAGHPCSEGGLLANTEIVLHQAHAQLGRAIIVRASISMTGKLPATNKSRKRLVESLNRVVTLTPDLFSPIKDITNPIGVFLLVCPNRRQPDGIGEIAVAIVDHLHDTLVFYETIERVLARYAPSPAPTGEPPIARRQASAYQPPEERGVQDDEKKHG